MPKPSVTAFLSSLEHRRKPDIERVRGIILKAVPSLTEQVKWNAPSFGPAGEDRVTFRLQPGDKVDLIFHRGAKPKAGGFSFVDETGLLTWLAPDRGIVSFADAAEIEARAAKLAALVKRWIAATA